MTRLIFRTFLLLLCVSFFATSCVSKQDIIYFQNAKDFETIVNTDTFKAKLKVGDIVSVYVSVYHDGVNDPTKPYNLIRNSGTSSESINYLVDVDGNIDFPVLGKVNVEGLTVEEVKLLFKKKFSDGQLLKDPVIIVRILNFRITVQGEVRSPGVYQVPGERISILEVLGMAGDLTIKGRRDNIMVIRDFNGTKTISRINLTNKEVFDSPVFYLTQNDVVYVEPNNSAISGASGDLRINSIITIGSFILTTALIFVTRN